MRSVATWLCGALLWGALALPVGCDVGLSDLASFLDTPFADVTAEVTQLRDDEVGDVMTELMLRFRSYLALRDAIPFAALAPEACMSEVRGGADDFSFEADVNCTFGDDVAPADGVIRVEQRVLAEEPPVTELELEYRQVNLGALTVSGRERIEETDATNGASLRSIDLVQDGVEFDYDFRLGLLDGDAPVFDYLLDTAGGGAIARITNPTTPGGFVTVYLTGIDGTLTCEVRDAAWAPGDPARGVCENGVTFGLPQ